MQVQLQAADVAKLACDFVKEVIKISKAYRKSISPDNTDMFEAFAKHVKALLLSPFISANDVHCLKQKADSLNFDIVPETLTCNDQVAITITPITKVCSQVTTLENPYPKVVLVDDSEHPSSYVTLKSTSSCWTTVQTNQFAGGCTETQCDEVYQGRIDIIKNYTLPSYPSINDSVISLIKLYETDNNGNIYTTHLVNLDPATSPYYGSINPEDVKLGSPNFPVAFKSLLNNFANTRPGIGSTAHLIDPRIFGSTLQFLITAKHKAKRLLGIDKNDAVLFIKTPSNGIVELTASDTAYSTYPINFYRVGYVPSPCGTYNPLIQAQSSNINFNTSLTNFNIISLSSDRGIDPILLTNSTRDCNIVELTASYSTIGELTSRQWNTSFNTNIYESDSILADRIGTYYFTVLLENGCTVYKEYQLTDISSNSLSDDVLIT